MAVWSCHLPRRTPETTPIASPASVDHAIAASVSQSKRVPISSDHRLARFRRAADIAAQGLPEVMRILLQERAFEAHLGSHRRHFLSRRLGPGHQSRRIARQEAHEAEYEHRYREQDDEGARQPPQDEGEHRPPVQTADVPSVQRGVFGQEPAIRHVVTPESFFDPGRR